MVNSRGVWVSCRWIWKIHLCVSERTLHPAPRLRWKTALSAWLQSTAPWMWTSTGMTGLFSTSTWWVRYLGSFPFGLKPTLTPVSLFSSTTVKTAALRRSFSFIFFLPNQDNRHTPLAGTGLALRSTSRAARSMLPLVLPTHKNNPLVDGVKEEFQRWTSAVTM